LSESITASVPAIVLWVNPATALPLPSNRARRITFVPSDHARKKPPAPSLQLASTAWLPGAVTSSLPVGAPASVRPPTVRSPFALTCSKKMSSIAVAPLRASVHVTSTPPLPSLTADPSAAAETRDTSRSSLLDVGHAANTRMGTKTSRSAAMRWFLMGLT
jgi:hypothetical protein